MSRDKEDPKRTEQEQAWIGDAVLALYARQWILQREGKMDAEMFTYLTSNHFLSTIGNPTSVEAAIGRVYRSGGLATAFAHIESELLPRFLSQEKKRIREAHGQRRP
jgi:dsRNA-specific ribonuclease